MLCLEFIANLELSEKATNLLVAWLRPLAYRHKKLCAHGKGPGDARSKNKKIKYLAIERQIEK